jgi:hypothetical protein
MVDDPLGSTALALRLIVGVEFGFDGLMDWRRDGGC